ncbi:hypothetical protein EV424DRAFT_1538061 [Suillus variegatus]|nr:hypothetical protein EV424DRAFT_1538061 [Suillus variegatus]
MACIRDGYGALLGDRPDKRDPLWYFSSRKELICAFCDFMVAHEAMIQQRVLYGDLSPNNFVISEGIGYFIDFDHASIIKEGETFTVSFGTRTVPYISMCILKKMSKNTDIIKKSKTTIDAKKSNSNTNSIAQLELVEHNSSDDLESLFYIFFEFVSKYGGAHGTLAPTWDKTTMPVSEYFTEFKPIINEWRTRIHRTESNLEGAIIHEHIFQMLAKFITKLNNEEPSPLPSPPLPVAPPSAPSTHRTGAPPIIQPMAGPSLRRSLRLSAGQT